ncbi:MAG: hypothetical protein H8E25_13310 [Planctomycetes bacterium]|nr:hypothetical protein [Planctomycetota bacterium]
MKLIIAEKPSVANDLANALPGKFAKIEDSYWQGENYLISWAVGHLLELAEPEHYNPALSGWSLADLPVIPSKFVRKPREGATKQLRLLKKLAQREEINTIVNACDAAREGELIFREIEKYVDTGKPSERLWLQSMTKDAILSAFGDIRAGSDFEGLSDAAYCRAEGDWLVGINATRGITKRLKGRRERGVWSAGRVQTPTLAILAHKEVEVLAHIPIDFWRLKGSFSANGHKYDATYRTSRSGKDGDKIWKEADADALAKSCEGQPTAVTERVTNSTRNVPALFDLTSLQKEANNRFGFSAIRTSGAAQRLYEGHKVLTYPRTDSKALPEDYVSKVDDLLSDIASGSFVKAFVDDKQAAFFSDAAKQIVKDGKQNQKRNFDNSKVGDHFAIIPTGQLPKTTLGGDDAKIFELVVRRFLASFMKPSKWENVVRETVITPSDNSAITFFTESKRMVYAGWMLVHRIPKVSEQLPDLGVETGKAASGSVNQISCEADSTRPPKRYTEAGLLRQMEIATDVASESLEDIDDDEVLASMQGKGLGTPATRAQTIEALVRKGYVLRNGKTLRAAAKGITLIDFLERVGAIDLAKAEQTAEMESSLYKVEHGDMPRSDYMASIESTTRELVDKFVNFSYEELYKDEESVGKCPLDKHEVREGLKGYRCSRRAKGDTYKLTIKSMGKEAQTPLAGIAEIVHKYLAARDEVTEVEDDLKRTNGYINFKINRISFVDDYIAELLPLLIAIAPENSLKEDFKIEAVEPDACGYTIWKEFRGRFINRPLASRLLDERDSGPIEGFVSMRGESYAGRIKVDDENKLEFEPVKNFKSDDEKGAVGQEEISYEVNKDEYLPCPLGKGMIVETATHFESSEPKGVKFPRTVCQREMTRADLISYFGEAGHTDWIEDFISRKGRNFTARLVRKPNGRHGFEFKPRDPAAKKKKSTKKKSTKKKSTKKKTSKKKSTKKKV